MQHYYQNPAIKLGGTFQHGNQCGGFQSWSSFGKQDGRLNTVTNTGKQSVQKAATNTAWNTSLPKN